MDVLVTSISGEEQKRCSLQRTIRKYHWELNILFEFYLLFNILYTMGSLSASSVSYFFETLANGQSRTFCLKQQKTCWCVSDVNECGTQLVLCDANADCLNWFGSYSCRCRSGFQDVSRMGSGGTVCVEATEAAGATAAVCQRGMPQVNSHQSPFFLGCRLQLGPLS